MILLKCVNAIKKEDFFMSKYIQTPAYYDRMPVDISFVFENERPAGKHGFLKPDGDDFRFEDGTLGKFWGVMFNGGANFPTHDYAEKVARRIAMTGCNVVRLHQLDAEWCMPNIYQLHPGPRLKDTRHFDPECLDRLDYLIYCLKKEGIYLSIDMCTYRKYKLGDGVKHADMMGDCARFFSMIDPVMIDLQKETATNLWNHYNPYTKLAYKDDPVFAFCVVCNENDLLFDASVRKHYERIPYYENMFKEQMKEWLKENNIEYDVDAHDVFDSDDIMMEYKLWKTEWYYNEMMDHIRGLGVKTPMVGSNWNHGNMTIKASRVCDFTDYHLYISDWHWGEFEKVCWNKSMTDGETNLGKMAHVKLNKKPVFFTEWDVCWPNSYRATGAPYFAAIACLQNWTGMTVHTYSYGSFTDRIQLLGKESSSSSVGSISYREGMFSVWNDPAKFGLFYHCALMLRRGDVKPCEKLVGVNMTDIKANTVTAYNSLVERHRVCTTFEGQDTEGISKFYDDTVSVPREDNRFIRSDTGEVWRDLVRSIAVVDSPKTKIAYGFIGRGGSAVLKKTDKSIKLNGMVVESETDFGVIALSSLTDEDIEHSDHMLLSTIGRARNTGCQFDGEKMIDFGEPPILSEVIEADIAIKTDKKGLCVWGVNADGYYVGKLPATYEDGWYKFHVGDTYQAQYYLIMLD